jgi:hypothetical protein
LGDALRDAAGDALSQDQLRHAAGYARRPSSTRRCGDAISFA